MLETAKPGLMHHPGLRQFVKFCIIGASGTVIDVSIARYLTFAVHLNWIIAQTISFLVAVTNSYIWNSQWTFRGMGSGNRHAMYIKFVGINAVGLLLNVLIMKSVFFAFTGHIINQGPPDPHQWNLAKGLAVVLVALWNFFANRKWTFKGEPEPPTIAPVA